MAAKFKTEIAVLPRDIDINGHEDVNGRILGDGLHLVCTEI